MIAEKSSNEDFRRMLQASEVRGEGLFLRLKEDVHQNWERRPEVRKLAAGVTMRSDTCTFRNETLDPSGLPPGHRAPCGKTICTTFPAKSSTYVVVLLMVSVEVLLMRWSW